MKKNINKIILFISVLLSFLILTSFFINALPYYDLKFEKISEDLVRGNYEKVGESINLKEDTEITMLIKKAYDIDINATLTKEEEDAISQVFGAKLNQKIEITKEEDIKIEGNVNTYIEIRPVYKEIRGYLVQDYNSWNKKKEVTIKIPIDVEHVVKTNA
ncbi:MAG: hypothetical protein ACRDA3_04240 [Peptostreptococcaceae bacterium]